MVYANETVKFSLPSPGLGDLLNPDDEFRFAQIVDNQMFGAIRVHSGGNGVIRHGPLALLNASDGTFTVIMFENKAGGKPVVEAFINQIYIFTESSLRWEGLANSTSYYLFVQLIETDDTESSLLNKQVVTSFNTTGEVPDDGILIAVVDVDEPGSTVFTEDPAGRIDIPVLGDHIADNQNPHGPTLFQDDIVVSGLTILDFIRFADLQIESLTISGNSIISGNITVLGDFIVSGTVLNNGGIEFNEITTQNFTVPGKFTAGEVLVSSGLDVYSTSLFREDIQLASGVTIDGFDPSVGIPLIDGSNADSLHSHTLGSLADSVKQIHFAPEFCNTLISGETTSGIFETRRFFNNNFYEWFTTGQGVAVSTVTKVILPDDFESVDRIEVNHGIGSNVSGGNTTLFLLDKDGNEASLTGNVFTDTQIVTETVTVSGGQILPQEFITLINRMDTHSGIGINLGDMTLFYVPRHGEKLIFDWNYSGNTAIENFDGLRVAPCDLRTEKVLVSQPIGLSGQSVFDVSFGPAETTPTTMFTSVSRPELDFGATGKSFLASEREVNTIISGGHIITASIDQIVSGTEGASVQLIAHRI